MINKVGERYFNVSPTCLPEGCHYVHGSLLSVAHYPMTVANLGKKSEMTMRL